MLGFVLHGIGLPFVLAVLGVGVAWYLYMARPDLPAAVAERTRLVHWILVHKYGFDGLYEVVITAVARGVGRLFWRVGDAALIDGFLVDGSARLVGWLSTQMRKLQTGYLYTYAFAMIFGLLALMSVFVFGPFRG